MGTGASKLKQARAAPARNADATDLQGPEESTSPRVGASQGRHDEKLLELRESVGKSLRSLEEKLQGSDSQRQSLAAEDLAELKDSLEAVEDGVAEARAASARAVDDAINSSKEAVRKSTREASVLSLKLANQHLALEKLQEKAALLKGDRDRIRVEMEGLIKSQSSAMADILKRQTQLLQAPPAAARDNEKQQQKQQQQQVEELQRQLHAANLRADSMRVLAEKQFAARREMSSRLIAAQGPVRVMCRVRPPLPSEAAPSVAVRAVGTDTAMVSSSSSKGPDKMYRLDRVLSQSEGQPAVGHEVLPLIEAAMDGSSAAVVLYGAKSSGKAFTAIGRVSEPGLFMLALGEVFNLAGEREGMQDFSIGLSILQISDNITWDYLGHDGESPGLAGEAVSPVFVQTLAEAVRLQDQGLQAVAEGASRDIGPSSLLLTIFVTSANRLTGEETNGKLQIVQAATSSAEGSHDAPMSVVLLGDCIVASLKQQDCSWNSSVLTMLLRDSLAPPSPNAIVMVTVSPAAKDSRETVAALNFASRCFNATPQGARTRPASVAEAIRT